MPAGVASPEVSTNSSVRSRLEQLHDQSRAVIDAGLVEDPFQMELDGSFADAQRLRDQPVGEAVRNPSQDFALALSQVPALGRDAQRIVNDDLVPRRAQDREET